MDRLEDPEAPIPRDPGLARERTELAWNRSGLAALVAVAVMLRRLWPLEGYRSDVAIVLIAVGAVTWALGMRHARHTATGSATKGFLSPRAGRLLTAGTLALAAAGFVLGLLR